MIGLDTNVVVRYIMQDDAKQASKATRLIEAFSAEAPGFMPVVATIELVWVLESSFELTREQVSQALAGLLAAKELQLEQAAAVVLALRRYRAGRAEFADCLLHQLADQAGCTQTMTFDARAARDAGMTLLA